MADKFVVVVEFDYLPQHAEETFRDAVRALSDALNQVLPEHRAQLTLCTGDSACQLSALNAELLEKSKQRLTQRNQ